MEWREVARGVIYRDGAGREQLSLGFPPSTYRFYRLKVLGGDSPPLSPEGVSVLAAPRKVLFRRPGPGQLFLLYGNPEVSAPRYDPAPFQDPAIRSAGLTDLGPEVPVVTEPGAAEPPQPPPRSDADSRLWRFERTFQGVPAGG